MAPTIKTTQEIGFCFGVRRALDLLTAASKKSPQIDTFGDLVHNEEVVRRLSERGIKSVSDISGFREGATVAISAHGVGPEVERELATKGVSLINATCPDVKKAQRAARQLMQEGFWILIFGDAEHQEVRGLLGWAEGKGLATRNMADIKALQPLPSRIGILSQTTQTAEQFTEFAKNVVELALSEAVEVRIINTICHGVKKRQNEAMNLAKGSDVMLVVGSPSSANTMRLVEICGRQTQTYRIGSAGEIDLAWLKGKKSIGVTSGTSTSPQTIDEILKVLESIT